MEEPDVPPKAEDGEGKKFGHVFRSLFIPPHRFLYRQKDDAITKLGLDESKVEQKKRNEGVGADGVEAKREEVAEVEGDEEGTAGTVDVEKISAAASLVSASKGEGESNESKRNYTVGVHAIEEKRVGVSEAGGGEEGTGGEVDGEKVSATSSKGDDEDSEKKQLSGESYATPKDEEVDDNRTEFPYPRRPGLLNCAYYMRTGICGYGENCKFNHPPRTNGIQVGQWNSSESVQKPDLEDEKELPGKVGLIECKYFLTLGGCKFGSSCKFGHSQEISQATEIVGIKLNFVGLPIRPGQKECPYYMRTGECKFSSNCRFNHPDPTAVESQDFVVGWENGESPEQHASAEINMPNCIPSFLFPPKGLNCEPKFRSQVPQNPFPPSGDNIQPPSLATSVGNTKVVQQVADKVYPERPGQPECSYYMKTGDCKFKFACKFHHPRNRLMGASTCSIGPLGLPCRPDQPICSFYSRFGLCKFGPACKYDHPVDFACSSPVTGGSRLV